MARKLRISPLRLGIALLPGVWALYFSQVFPGVNFTWKLIGSLLLSLTVYQTLKWLGRAAHLAGVRLDQIVDSLAWETLMGGICGLGLGMLAGAVSAYPLSTVGGTEGAFLVLVVFITSGFLGFKIGSRRGSEFLRIMPGIALPDAEHELSDSSLCKVVDTSAIIDGRIYDVCLSKFLEGLLVVPTFVIEELQHIADSSDHIRRSKGRRGLELLSKMQKHPNIKVDIIDSNPFEEKEVDAKLIRLCKQLRAAIITNDYNLNKVAELQGIRVLNINELTNAVKVMVYPGETMHTTIIKEGKEHGQGVGYLEDGTMVVVEDAYDEIGRDLEVTVTSVFQTAAGRMIFTRKMKNDMQTGVGSAIQNVQEVKLYG
ncbi:MAG TPA: PIN domain-containing protein [Syntrophomonadaceae bacterium]|nr:PIN domain-containing protein [Syntrophomonadaceae bacterium]